jgi:hypothetical protein
VPVGGEKMTNEHHDPVCFAMQLNPTRDKSPAPQDDQQRLLCEMETGADGKPLCDGLLGNLKHPEIECRPRGAKILFHE